MSSTAATVDVGLITVVVNSERATLHTRTPYFPPFPPKKFECSPGNHGLPRTGLKALWEESSFLATMDATAYRMQDLSLAESPARQATAPAQGSVYVVPPTPAESTPTNVSLGRKFANCRSMMFSKCTQSVRASFRRMILKSSERTKKAKGASRPASNGRPKSRPWLDQGANPLPAVATTELADIPMEDVQQAPSLLPTSPAPIPMEVEAELPSSNATLVPETRQTQFEVPMGKEPDSPATDASSTVMGDSEEDVWRATEVMQQTEAGGRTLLDPVAMERVPPTTLNQDVDMEDVDNSGFASLQQASMPLPPAVQNKEAEVKAFFAQLKTSRRPVKSQPKPTPPPGSSEPKKTKGSAARSLMDDIMAGFQSATRGKSSQEQVAIAVDPPTQPRPVATTTTLHSSPAVLPNLPCRTTPVVAGRQPGPQPTPPRHVGTGSEVSAPGGSMIPPSEAPSSAGIPTIGTVNGPSAGNQVQLGLTCGAAPSGTATDSAMDGVESGRAVKGSRRATRAIARTGWTLETAQQKTREAQIAQDVENNIEVAPPPASSLRAFEERAKSSAWHAAQPPPPPEAIPYIDVARACRRAA